MFCLLFKFIEAYILFNIFTADTKNYKKINFVCFLGLESVKCNVISKFKNIWVNKQTLSIY